MDAMSALRKFNPDIIFASWIPYGLSLDYELASLDIPMILISEGYGGCTGSEMIWDEGLADYNNVLDEIYPNLHDVPQWYGIHDRTYLINWRKR